MVLADRPVSLPGLQVSRSARVEPSAEVELAEPFQPAATNMGPPLSKSSMLLRWLNGADEGLPETAAAAQLAAAAAASGGSGVCPANRTGAGGRSGRGGGRGSALGMSLDRLPLLSLAAQQKGIVFSKLPTSAASSPAVSLAEGSSVHMLRVGVGAFGVARRPENFRNACVTCANFSPRFVYSCCCSGEPLGGIEWPGCLFCLLCSSSMSRLGW